MVMCTHPHPSSQELLTGNYAFSVVVESRSVNNRADEGDSGELRALQVLFTFCPCHPPSISKVQQNCLP